MPAKQKNKPKTTTEENPNAFKHLLGPELIQRMAGSILKAHRRFDVQSFLKLADGLNLLELKERVQWIRAGLHQHLPQKYADAVRILLSSAQDGTLAGFDLWPYSEFIQVYGLDDPSLSLNALATLTPRFTSEFAVRPYLLEHPAPTLKFLLTKTRDSDSHLRRWASEGTRPRLPWGVKLKPFIADPRATAPILEALKFDEELYVRKSVANHLNDLAKDHPEEVIARLTRWQKEAGPTHAAKIDWTIRRALRSLIKSGHPGALALIGASQNLKIAVSGLKLSAKKLKLNQTLGFSFIIRSRSRREQKLVVDYVIHHLKANGDTKPKVFKLKTMVLPAGVKRTVGKTHSLKVITTRRYCPGRHVLEIQINGISFAKSNWELQT